jgi:DNA-binding response OmpR family regulator
MTSAGDRILLVENDPEISDLIARQALTSVGYSVDVVVDSSSAIKQALLTPPDLIIADLNLPGLSAKDLLVALASQGISTPLMVIANKGQEQDIIQAFRLGAAEY